MLSRGWMEQVLWEAVCFVSKNKMKEYVGILDEGTPTLERLRRTAEANEFIQIVHIHKSISELEYLIVQSELSPPLKNAKAKGEIDETNV